MEINNPKDIPAGEISFENLRVHYRTYRIYTTGSRTNKKVFPRKGMKTNLGDIREDIWYPLALKLIKESGEMGLFEHLYEYYADSYLGKLIFHEEERRIYAAELHICRIFDIPAWVGYLPFNYKYRPDVINQEHVLGVTTECCKTPAQIMQEQIRILGQGEECFCPICGRFGSSKKIEGA